MLLHRLLAFLLAAIAAAAVTRLIRLGLNRRFPLLLVWLILVGLEGLLSGALPQSSGSYFWMYVIVEPAMWIGALAAVVEIFSLGFAAWPGIRTVGRWAVYAGIGGATAAVVLVAHFFHRTSTHGSIVLFYVETVDRAIIMSIAIVILAVRVLLARYPVDLGKNTLLTTTLFCIVFLSETGRLLVDSMTPLLVNDYVDWIQDTLEPLSILVWSLMLEPAGAPAAKPKLVQTAHEEHLLDQLEAANRLLTRLGRAG